MLEISVAGGYQLYITITCMWHFRVTAFYMNGACRVGGFIYDTQVCAIDWYSGTCPRIASVSQRAIGIASYDTCRLNIKREATDASSIEFIQTQIRHPILSTYQIGTHVDLCDKIEITFTARTGLCFTHVYNYSYL